MLVIFDMIFDVHLSFFGGKIGKIYTFLTCGQLNITPKKIAVQIPHRERYLSKYTRHSDIIQNLHVFILGHLQITAKNSTVPV